MLIWKHRATKSIRSHGMDWRAELWENSNGNTWIRYYEFNKLLSKSRNDDWSAIGGFVETHDLSPF